MRCKSGFGLNLGFISIMLNNIRKNMERSKAIFPYFVLQYNYRWNIFHLSTLLFYQTAGLWMVVPGIGSGNWDAARTPFLTRLVKSENFKSSLDGCVFPGVISPIFFLCCAFTSASDSAKSLSIVGILADSYKKSGAKRRIIGHKNGKRVIKEYSGYGPKEICPTELRKW